MKAAERKMLEEPSLLEVLRAGLLARKRNESLQIYLFAPEEEVNQLASIFERVLKDFGSTFGAIRIFPLTGLSEVLPTLCVAKGYLKKRGVYKKREQPDDGSRKIAVIMHSKEESVDCLSSALSDHTHDLAECSLKVFRWGAVRQEFLGPKSDPRLTSLLRKLRLGVTVQPDSINCSSGSAIFFRNMPQLDFLREEFIRWGTGRRRRKIRIDGCSTGGEAFTIAMILADLGMLDCVQIVASDISADRISEAAKGCITRRDFFRIPQELRRFIYRTTEGIYIAPRIVASVEFRVEDALVSPDKKGTEYYDLVLLQNVTVHMAKEDEKRAISIASERVVPGGLLLLGGARLASWSGVLDPSLFEPIRENAREIHDGWRIQRQKYDASPDTAPEWALPPFQEEAGWEWQFVTAFRRGVGESEHDVNEPVIELRNVGIQYRVPRRLGRKQGIRKDPRWEGDKFWALRQIDLSIYDGEVVGILGRNGSGKSSLGQLLAGAFDCDEGSIFIRGKATLLALGLGFKPDLSGRDNIMINGVLLGNSRRQVREKIEEIVDFAGIGEFIDEPVKNYSSGMRARLGFSIAVSFKPEILILDEVLATGDAEFKERARSKINELISEASVVIVISHQIAFVKAICTWAIWLSDGRIVGQGEPKDIAREYQANLQNPIEED